MNAGITGIDHVAVVVRDLEQALDFYVRVLGLEVVHRETLESEGVKTAFVRAGTGTIELMEPTSPDSYAARHLKRYGQGFAHLCLGVEDIDAVKRRLEDEDLYVLGQGVRQGAQGRKVLFLHPKDNAGVLTEFSQRGPEAAGEQGETPPGPREG